MGRSNNNIRLRLRLRLCVYYLFMCCWWLRLAQGDDGTALLAFKAGIRSGAVSSWNTTVPFCRWAGVACTEQRVSGLVLESMSLAGTVSPVLANLTRLTTLRLADNMLTGEIPSSLGDIPSLVHLNLSANNLTGAIPPSLGKLHLLTSLDLSSNILAGEIPATLGNLANLTDLTLSNNTLEGALPASLGNLSRLSTLDLSMNNLQGELPSDIGASLLNLRILSLYTNQLTGPIPISLANISGLERIRLSGNRFTGKIPANFGMLKNLWWLSLQENQLVAREPNDWDFIQSLTNCSLLEHLSLDENLLSGTLPSAVGNLSTRLTWLSMWDNNLTGEIPREIANLANLTVLALNGNRFSGRIPDSIGQLSNLRALALFDNQLSGEIPSSIGNLTWLSELHLYQNQLQGEIPASIGNCQNLNILELSSNRLSGSIPKELLSIPSLSYYLDLSNNLLSGPLPPEVARLQSLGYLNLSYNHLSDRIPDGLGQCLGLETLCMNNNLFNGSIPSSFQNLRGLKLLDLSYNNLSGAFPDYLAEFPFLEQVNLSFNDLTGKVPSEGIFANRTAVSILGNSRVCGDISSLDIPACPSEAQPKKNKHLVVKIVVPVACGIVLVILVTCLYIAYKSKRNTRKSNTHSFKSNAHSFKAPLEGQFPHLSYPELVKATDGFSFDNLIGVGAYSSVFKGNLSTGELIAVKVLDLQHKGAFKSFIAECEVLTSIRHRNLLKILTVCSSIDSSGNEFKALVFEFMPNGNLDTWMHPKLDQKIGSLSLTLVEKVNIAVDVAAALNYLHNHCPTPIVHCDLKPSNVLLDEDMTAHVADFGLARFLQKINGKGYKAPSTSLAVQGSIGYVPPEYGVGNHVSSEGDVYSYGVLLLELFTGKRPTDDMFKDGLTLQKFVENEMSNRSDATQIIDASLFSKETTDMGEKLEKCLQLILRTGLSCAKTEPRERMEIKDVLTLLVEVRELLFN